MPLFSEHFSLGKEQPELDFVDVPVDGDIPLFIDPFSIATRVDRWSEQCHRTIVSFFSKVVDTIRGGNDTKARELLVHLREPNETRFGYSSEQPQGAGIGRLQAEQLLQALRKSTAVKTGFLRSLAECELVVPGVAWDKISDLTTNIIRQHLAEYTSEQCCLLGVPTSQVALPPYYSLSEQEWLSAYFNLPVASDRPVLLVPKAVARYDPSYNHVRYYRQFVLNYLQTEHLDANDSLVRTLSSGRRVVYKKDLEPRYPCTKEYLFEFSRKHPEVLEEYRRELAQLERTAAGAFVEREDERLFGDALSAALRSIPAGNDHAGEYHNIMMGLVEFLFFPNLLYPVKEREIHEGRKRIDITMENGAFDGVFRRLHEVRKLPCAFVMFECKNYRTEVANPELDQLGGRFSPNRGKVGFLCCRRFEDRELFVRRCQDTFRDDRGLILPLDDETATEWLSVIAAGHREELDERLAGLVNEVWLA